MRTNRSKSSKKVGRPPSGINKRGEPEKVSDYPKLTIYIHPATKARLDIVSKLDDEPAWKVVEKAFHAYVESKPKEDKRIIESVVKRLTEKAEDAKVEPKTMTAKC